MTPIRAALLSLFMMSGIAFWGVGIYAASATNGYVAVDGYGVSASNR